MAAVITDAHRPTHLYGADVDYAIVGLGDTGRSVIEFLRRQNASLRVLDTRAEPPALEAVRAAYPDVEIITGGIDAQQLAGAAELIVSPGFDLRHPALVRARAAGVRVAGDIDLFARFARAPVIGVTGTNGKSTVTTLVTTMLRAAGLTALSGGNLGPPALDLLQQPVPDYYVLELSSFQLEVTHRLQCAVACLLNVEADHLDRHGDIEHYAAIKRRVLRGAGTVVLNVADPRTAAPPADVPRLGFRNGPPGTGEYGIVTAAGSTRLVGPNDLDLDVAQLRLRGDHNYANALAALAITDACGAARATTLPALCAFAGLPHRAELVATRNGIDFVNDSKATNPAAAAATISGSLEHGGIVIAGGESKGFDFSGFAATLAAYADGVVLIGRDADAIAAALDARIPLERANSMDTAVALAAGRARPGQTVLLAPACASFDMYRDYRDRGDAFRDAVSRLGCET